MLAALTAASAPAVPVAAPEFVATTHPVTAILSEIVAGRGNVTTLVPPGSSPHTFDPRPSQVRRTSEAAALLFVATQFDGWAARLPARHRVELLALVPEARRLAGFSSGELQAGEWDPHFWLNPLAVRALAEPLGRRLCEIDPAGCATYSSNAATFSKRLTALDEELSAQLGPIAGTGFVLFHSSLRYLLDRYGLVVTGVITPFPGKEPTPRALAKIIRRLGRERIRVVLTEPQLPLRPAQAVAEAAEARLVEVDPIGGGPGRSSYFELLRYNADALIGAVQ